MSRTISCLVRTCMTRILSRVLRLPAPAESSSTLNATRTGSLSSALTRSSKSQTTIIDPDETMALTFPDGRVVNSLPELSEWLEAIEDDPGTSEMGKQIAWMIANKIRAKLN